MNRFTLRKFWMWMALAGWTLAALLYGTGVAHADPYCPGCAAPGPIYPGPQPNQLYPPFGGPPMQWQGPSGSGGCFNYGNTGVHCS